MDILVGKFSVFRHWFRVDVNSYLPDGKTKVANTFVLRFLQKQCLLILCYYRLILFNLLRENVVKIDCYYFYSIGERHLDILYSEQNLCGFEIWWWWWWTIPPIRKITIQHYLPVMLRQVCESASYIAR